MHILMENVPIYPLSIRILKIKIVKSGVDEILLAVGTVSDFIFREEY